MNHQSPAERHLCVIPGDGVGQEVIPPAVELIKLLLPDVTIEGAEAGWDAFQKYGEALPREAQEIVLACKNVLFGATASPSQRVEGYTSPIVQLRRLLDVYTNIRPTRAWEGISPAADIDVVIVRESTEGLYSGRERLEGDEAITERVISRQGSARVARRALAIAARSGRPLTIVHKANVLRLGDGLWRETCLECATEYPGVQVDEGLVDAVAYHMVREPGRYQLLLCPNLYGDILSDLASALGGGLGMAPSLTLGDGTAIAEPVHGAAPDIAGKGIANPIGTLLSVAMLLREAWGEHEAAARVETAISLTLKAGCRTADIATGGERPLTTRAFTDAVIERL